MKGNLARSRTWLENRYVKLLLIVMPIFLLLGAFGTSKVFDAKLTSVFGFIRGLSPIYYLAYFFIVGILLYFGYVLFVKAQNSSNQLGLDEFHILLYILLFTFTVYFVLSLFTNPLPRETGRIAKIFHLLENGTLKGISSKPESIGPPLFWSPFIKITSLDPIFVTAYLTPFILYTLVAFCLYAMLRSATDSKFALIGTLFSITSIFIPFNASRSSFASPLFVLFVGGLLKYLKGKSSRSISIILLLLLTILTLTHPAFSLLSVLILVAGLLFTFIFGYVSRKGLFSISEKLKNIAAYGCVTWIGWFLLRSSILPGKEKMEAIWNMVTKGFIKIQSLEPALAFPMEPTYQLFSYPRILITILFLTIPLALILRYYSLFKTTRYRSKTFIVFFISYLIFLFFVFMSAFTTRTSVIRRVSQISLLFIPFLLVPAIEENLCEQKRKISKILLILVGISSILYFFLLWVPTCNYVQIPAKEESMMRAYSSYGPPEASPYGLGADESQSGLVRDIYGSRENFHIQRWVSIGSLYSEEIYIPPKSYIIFDGSIVSGSLKHSFDPPISERLEYIQASLEKNHANKIYSSGNLYHLWKTSIIRRYIVLT